MHRCPKMQHANWMFEIEWIEPEAGAGYVPPVEWLGKPLQMLWLDLGGAHRCGVSPQHSTFGISSTTKDPLEHATFGTVRNLYEEMHSSRLHDWAARDTNNTMPAPSESRH